MSPGHRRRVLYLQIAVRDVTHMEEVIDSMMPYLATNTSMILASPVPWNSICRPRATARSRGRTSRPGDRADFFLFAKSAIKVGENRRG